MSSRSPQLDARFQPSYRLAPPVQRRFDRQHIHSRRTLNRQAQQRARRDAWRSMRAQERNSIRGGFLVPHRRMFGVSHKHVQPGAAPVERS